MHYLYRTFLLLCLFSQPLFAARLPSEAEVTLSLSHVEKNIACPDFLVNMPVKLDYHYDFSKNMGLARILEIANTGFQQPLHPMGLQGYFGFMSDMAPQTLELPEGSITVYRVIFHLHYSGLVQVFLMLNQNGSCILRSEKTSVYSAM